MLRFPFSCLETAKWLQQLSHTHVCTGGCSGSHPPPAPKWVLGAPRCPPDPKLDASSFGKRQTTGVSPREKFGKTSFLGASSAPPPMKMSPLAFACVNPDGFLVSSPADTLSVPRWSPQIPRRDLGNSIKHRYAGPGVGWERAMGTPEPSLASPRAPWGHAAASAKRMGCDEHLLFLLLSRTGALCWIPSFPRLAALSWQPI